MNMIIYTAMNIYVNVKGSLVRRRGRSPTSKSAPTWICRPRYPGSNRSSAWIGSSLSLIFRFILNRRA